MKKFIVERNLPGAGSLSPEELQAISQVSCEVVTKLGHSYQWVESYVTNDKLYCVHIAENEAAIREHARLGNFPINTVAEIKKIINPLTSNPLVAD